jgi:hypothetical protein
VHLPPVVLLALLMDIKKLGRQSESVRLEILSGQNALCLLFLCEDALLAILDEPLSPPIRPITGVLPFFYFYPFAFYARHLPH